MSSNSTQTAPSSPLKCLVISCANYETAANQTIKFFNFPSDTIDRSLIKRWKEKCGVAADHDTRKSKVCSIHFTIDSFLDRSKTKLKPNAIPKENLDWMFGAPEIPTQSSINHNNNDNNIYPSSANIKLIHFDKVVKTVDENEQLKQRLNELEIELKPITKELVIYNKKVKYLQQELSRLNNLIYNKTDRRLRNCKFETNLMSRVFSQAQINKLISRKMKIFWNNDDLAMAFTLRHLGGRECYLYLKNKLNLPLPSLSAVQRWAASNK